MTTDLTLFVASTGGHLSELSQLAARIEPDLDARVWVTFDNPQSRSLLRGQKVHFVNYMAPRQWGALATNFGPALRILRRHRPHRVVSTGAGVALSFLPLAKFFGAEAVYVESAARIDGPSTTGKILARMPGVSTFTQHRRWENATWKFEHSVLDDFVASKHHQFERVQTPRILVQVGTLDFPFVRLVERVAACLPPDADVTWQLGATPAPAGLTGRHFDFASSSHIEDIMKSSTAVISHAGVGSALMALNNGIRPILVPRSSELGEHVDDHQSEIAEELESRGIAIHVDIDDIDSRLLSLDYRIPSSETRRELAT